jgi:hypothetical protein
VVDVAVPDGRLDGPDGDRQRVAQVVAQERRDLFEAPLARALLGDVPGDDHAGDDRAVVVGDRHRVRPEIEVLEGELEHAVVAFEGRPVVLAVVLDV